MQLFLKPDHPCTVEPSLTQFSSCLQVVRSLIISSEPLMKPICAPMEAELEFDYWPHAEIHEVNRPTLARAPWQMSTLCTCLWAKHWPSSGKMLSGLNECHSLYKCFTRWFRIWNFAISMLVGNYFRKKRLLGWGGSMKCHEVAAERLSYVPQTFFVFLLWCFWWIVWEDLAQKTVCLGTEALLL